MSHTAQISVREVKKILVLMRGMLKCVFEEVGIEIKLFGSQTRTLRRRRVGKQGLTSNEYNSQCRKNLDMVFERNL